MVYAGSIPALPILVFVFHTYFLETAMFKVNPTMRNCLYSSDNSGVVVRHYTGQYGYANITGGDSYDECTEQMLFVAGRCDEPKLATPPCFAGADFASGSRSEDWEGLRVPHCPY